MDFTFEFPNSNKRNLFSETCCQGLCHKHEIPLNFVNQLQGKRAQKIVVQLLPLVQECTAACYEPLNMQTEAAATLEHWISARAGNRASKSG